MLHHVSFNARAPERVANGLARLLGARAIRAPAPPFPSDAWFVCLGDDNGTLIEVMPWGETRDPANSRGVGFDEQMRPTSGAHVLLSTPHDREAIFAHARDEGWRVEDADAGLFKFIKVWIENAFLVELMPQDLKPAYVEAFNAEGVATLDGKLRAIERALAAK